MAQIVLNITDDKAARIREKAKSYGLRTTRYVHIMLAGLFLVDELMAIMNLLNADGTIKAKTMLLALVQRLAVGAPQSGPEAPALFCGG